MNIISHRGYWSEREEMNGEVAFLRSFANGFSIETDIRDCCGRLLISHDKPGGNELELIRLLEIADQFQEKNDFTFALNIKSDGLALDVKNILACYPRQRYFVFDMSIPDMRDYIQKGLPVFTRMSEYEQAPSFLSEAQGVWLDAFNSTWFSTPVIEDFLAANKQVCVVSSELHKREYISLWNMLKPLAREVGLHLCTDFPEQAHAYFKV